MVPEDRSQDISITLSVRYRKGLEVIDKFKLEPTWTSRMPLSHEPHTRQERNLSRLEQRCSVPSMAAYLPVLWDHTLWSICLCLLFSSPYLLPEVVWCLHIPPPLQALKPQSGYSLKLALNICLRELKWWHTSPDMIDDCDMLQNGFVSRSICSMSTRLLHAWNDPYQDLRDREIMGNGEFVCRGKCN